MKLRHEELKRLPKVLLHEHLDGVLRPGSVIDLARLVDYKGLPTEDPDDLARWFHQGANQGSLPKYLEGFAHTIAVMQTEEALERVAYEQAEDLSADGIVYFETRFAPNFTPEKGTDAPASDCRGAKRFGSGTQGLRYPFWTDHLRDAQYGRVARDGTAGRRFKAPETCQAT